MPVIRISEVVDVSFVKECDFIWSVGLSPHVTFFRVGSSPHYGRDYSKMSGDNFVVRRQETRL